MSLLNLTNPWPEISAADYEAHMSHPGVFQVRHDTPRISGSGVKAMDVLSGFKQDVDREFLEKQLHMAGLVRIRELSRIMGDGKELVRIDFRNT
jgi:hypothetical protein